MNRWLVAIALSAVAAAALGGCAPLLVGGVAAGTAMVATDRRPTGVQLDDETIRLRVAGEISKKLPADTVHVNVASYDRKVLLTGEVPTEQVKGEAERVAAASRDVREVVNDLAVMPATSLTSRAGDALVTTNVQAVFLTTQGIPANVIQVVTERGTVYLLGMVTQKEGEVAAAAASRASGVRKVVKVFHYVTPEELQRILGKTSPAPAPATPAPIETVPASR
jgi:osmotically-inducible protein OsmY